MFQGTHISAAEGADTLELAMLAVLLFTLILSTYHDVTRHRIPNILVLIAIASALIMRSVSGGASGMLLAIAGGLVGLIGLLPLYLLRAMGAGDVKLMAGVGCLLGPTAALLACGLTLIAGAVIAATFFFYTRFGTVGRLKAVLAQPLEPVSLSLTEHALKQRFPYAIAIMSGSLAAVFLNGSVEMAVRW